MAYPDLEAVAKLYELEHEHVDIVAKMYECFNKADMDTIKREVFAPDLVWALPGHHPLAGVKHGADEVIAFFAQLVKSGIHVDIVKIDGFGESTVVEVHRGYGEAKGYKLDALNCTHYEIENGKIARVQVYMGDQHAADGFFNAVYTLKPIPDRLAE